MFHTVWPHDGVPTVLNAATKWPTTTIQASFPFVESLVFRVGYFPP